MHRLIRPLAGLLLASLLICMAATLSLAQAPVTPVYGSIQIAGPSNGTPGAATSGTIGLGTWTTGTRPTCGRPAIGYNTTTGQVEFCNGTTWATLGGGGSGSGTVTSVGMSVPTSLFNLTGSPITSSGTLALSLASQTANFFLAAPNGSSGVPVYRALAPGDLPLATSSAYGAIRPDNTTTTVSGGVLSAIGGGLTATPTVGSGFGSSPTPPPAGQTSLWFQIVIGSGGTSTSGVVNLSATAPHGWACNPTINDIADIRVAWQPTSVTSVTFTALSATTGLVTPWAPAALSPHPAPGAKCVSF